MIAIDTTAAQAIDELTAATGVGPGGGLRIAWAAEADGRDFDLSIQPHPAADDVVVTHDDTRVFLDPRAARALSDKVLDVRTRHAGRIHFGVYPQA